MMDTAEVRERMPEQLLEEIETLIRTMQAVHATMVNVLDRFDVVESTITQLDSTNYPDGSGDLDRELMEESGASELYTRVHALAALLDMHIGCEPSSFSLAQFEQYGIGMPAGWEEHSRKVMDWYIRTAKRELKAEDGEL